MPNATATQVKKSNNPFDIFITGLRKGFNVAINNLMPNVLMAFVLAYILDLFGVMTFLGKVCGPVMSSRSGNYCFVRHLALLRGRCRCCSQSARQRNSQCPRHYNSFPGAPSDGFPDSVHGQTPRCCRRSEKILAASYVQ